MPSKVVAVGRNYADHVAELGEDRPPERPRIFLKPPSAIISSGVAIVLPPESNQVEHEAELAVVIGRRMRRVPAAAALEYVAGYCCANDVTARDIQRAENLPDYAKAFDTFCPLGEMVAAADVDPADLLVQCVVNGQVRQSGRTSAMLTPVPALLAHIAAAMTLQPGDVVLTGTPAGVGPLRVGDTVAVRISGLPQLVNPVTG
ncbi:MAG TPA: fumarylacetoacetate hydrolase family protein, partial [Streptosporangiaceae bacterium]|nr:fumarylacetoacetate hydrolase family protein [Streptosporangiaceae bacterium]